ncbi:MAG: hypothetical protein IKV43_02705 [Clostridia bacterium]|nr:hypothetical protein [Clostridia bacterium]
MATIKHIKKGVGVFLRQEENKFYFLFEGSDAEEYLTVTPKFKLESIETDDETLLAAIKEAIKGKPEPRRVRKHFKSLPVRVFPVVINEWMLRRVSPSLARLKKGMRFTGTGYTDMINKVLGTRMENMYRPATYRLDQWIGGCEAFFAFFDGQARDNGGEGFYSNYFLDEDTAIEDCRIKNLTDYEKIKCGVPTIRFVFRRDPDGVGDYHCCEFVGIFECISKDVYEIYMEPRVPGVPVSYEGRLVYKRHTGLEELWKRFFA